MHVCLQWKTHPFSEPNRKRRREKQEQAPAAGSLRGRRLVTSSRAARPVQCGRAALLPASPRQGGPCLQAPQRWRLRLVATVNSSIYLTDVKVKRAPRSAPRGHRQALQACTPRSHVHTGGGGECWRAHTQAGHNSLGECSDRGADKRASTGQVSFHTSLLRRSRKVGVRGWGPAQVWGLGQLLTPSSRPLGPARAHRLGLPWHEPASSGQTSTLCLSRLAPPPPERPSATSFPTWSPTEAPIQQCRTLPRGV